MKNKNKFLKAIGFSLSSFLVLMLLFSFLEPALTGAATANDAINVNLTVDPTITINSPSDVTMSPNITGTGASTGSVNWIVTTNNVSGWKLEVQSSASPAMTSGANSFADYTEGVLGTPEAWSVASSASEFGFSASGSFAESKYSSSKYQGFQGTTKIQVSHSNAAASGGDTTTVDFKAEVGSSKSQPTGAYAAAITATATSL